MTTLFISDLHLEESRPDITDAFLTFLREKAAGVEQLYILGDFLRPGLVTTSAHRFRSRLLAP